MKKETIHPSKARECLNNLSYRYTKDQIGLITILHDFINQTEEVMKERERKIPYLLRKQKEDND